MLSVDDDNTVRVTHYINPHCFWYKAETAYIPHHEQGLFSVKFNEHCEQIFGRHNWEILRDWCKHSKKPAVGDLVALRNQKLGRWIRCEVEEIIIDLSGAVWYQLWALDEGLPIKSVQEYIRPLPESYTREPAQAKRGALINILPAETQYDYVQGKNILERCPRWCPGIVSTLQALLDDALSVSMIEKVHLERKPETIFLGDIFIKTYADTTYNIVHLLHKACSDQMLISPATEFRKALLVDSLIVKRYKNNEGIDNTTWNKLCSAETNRSL